VRGFLLDTHALLWIALDDAALRPRARDTLFAAPLYASAISGAEIAIKASIGKLPLPGPFDTDFGFAFRTLLDRAGVDLLPFDLAAVERLRHLPLHHRDPFDRMIIAQALVSQLTVATRDRAFADYAGLEILEV
jgi:PIN domain nuclease of toxin-antitoxin system